MNPQYLQHNPYFGGQIPNATFGEPNANLPTTTHPESQSFPLEKSALGALPTGNVMPPPMRPQNPNETPISQMNQNNLVDQMQNVSLTGPKIPSTQDIPVSTESKQNVPVNGINNQNHYQPQGGPNTSQFTPGILNNPQTSSLPFQSGPGLPPISNQQYSGQPPKSGSFTESNIPKNVPLSNEKQIPGQQLPGFNRHTLDNHKNITGPPLPGQPAILGNQQPQNNGPPLSMQTPINQHYGPPIPGQNPLPPRHLNNAAPVGPGHQNLSGPSINQPPIQQNLSGPPLPGQQHLSGPPIPGQQHLPGQPMPGKPHLSGPQMPGQNLSGPPLPNQHLSRPPMPGQPHLSGPPHIGQQNMPPQASYSNQMPGQQYSSNPPLPGQQNSYPYSMNQGFQQPNYDPAQKLKYGNQAGPYQGGMPSGPGGYPTEAQQNTRLDPEQMPNPIQVFREDQRLKGGYFATNQKGLVPPLVSTKFIVQDQGNASPRFIRSSIYTVLTTSDLLNQTKIPFGIILSPMAQLEEGEYEPPIVNMGELGPVRCVRCKAYVSPFMQFVDAGRRFQCLFCKAITDVPTEYFQHLDHTGQRMDRFERPELMLGTFEYLATKDYCRNNVLPKPPAIIFVIDVSYNNVKSGLVHLICSQMKQIIRNLPIDVGQTKSNMKVGFITYNNSVQFYNCKANLAQPQMMYVGDVQDVFMPLLEGFLCDPEECESTIDSLMAQIPLMFGQTQETETILGPAIQAGLEALKASECAGKLLVFHSSLPIGEAPGKLRNRDDRNLLGTDKEKSVLAPQTNFYTNLAQECVGAGCSVDLFLFNNSYIDIATIGQVSRLTGGEVYKYTYFQAEADGERLITDIINNINRPTAFDAVMRVRTSTGVRPTDFYGHLYMSNTTDIELASIDCDKAIAIEIKHDDKLSEEDGVYIQAALLYTSCSGVRRLRIINLSLKTSSQIPELYKSCDMDAIINFVLKQGVAKLVEMSPKAIKDGFNSRCATILATYRKYCVSSTSSSQLLLPECIKLLPVYTNSLLKSDAITGGAEMTIDQKSYIMMTVSSMTISDTLAFVYPRLISLHNIDPHSEELPPLIRCSIDKFQDDGVYLLENGIHMFIWLGLTLNPQWVQAVFGVASVVDVNTDKTSIPVLDNSLNKRIRDIIGTVQSERRYCMRLTLVRQRDKMEMVMRHFLVEDRGVDGSPHYVDYLCHIHQQIRTLLS